MWYLCNICTDFVTKIPQDSPHEIGKPIPFMDFILDNQREYSFKCNIEQHKAQYIHLKWFQWSINLMKWLSAICAQAAELQQFCRFAMNNRKFVQIHILRKAKHWPNYIWSSQTICFMVNLQRTSLGLTRRPHGDIPFLIIPKYIIICGTCGRV